MCVQNAMEALRRVSENTRGQKKQYRQSYRSVKKKKLVGLRSTIEQFHNISFTLLLFWISSPPVASPYTKRNPNVFTRPYVNQTLPTTWTSSPPTVAFSLFHPQCGLLLSPVPRTLHLQVSASITPLLQIGCRSNITSSKKTFLTTVTNRASPF